MKNYRVTKYDPINRNSDGYYMKEEWTSIADIGDTIDGKKLSIQEYLKTENNYISFIKLLMETLSIKEFKVNALEKYDDELIITDHLEIYSHESKQIYKKVKNGTIIKENNIAELVKLILREHLWCKLESSKMVVHFGYDYYLYIGLNSSGNETISKINNYDLFIEEFDSPY